MSKLEQTSPDYDSYEKFVESERMELRREGAEELRLEILRVLNSEIERSKSWMNTEKISLMTARTIVERATI